MSLPGRLPKVVAVISILAAVAALAYLFVPTSGNPADLSQAQAPSAKGSTAPSGSDPGAASGRSVSTSGPTTVFAAVGDIACSPRNPLFHRGRGKGQWCRQKATAQVARRMHPDGVLMLGDAQYDAGLLREYKKSYKRSWGRFLPKTYPVLGNHDYWGGPPKGFFDFFGTRSAIGLDKGWYSFDVPGWHLIGLNSNCADEINCTPGSAEYTWLQQDLQASSGTECQVAFMHHPRWSSGPHGNQEAVWPLLRLLTNAGVDLLLVGHDHIYERFAPQNFRGKRDPHGIREIIVGTGGAQHYPIVHVQKNSVVRNAKTFGVLRLSLSKAAYAWKFKPIKGGSFTDSGSASCH